MSAYLEQIIKKERQKFYKSTPRKKNTTGYLGLSRESIKSSEITFCRLVLNIKI